AQAKRPRSTRRSIAARRAPATQARHLKQSPVGLTRGSICFVIRPCCEEDGLPGQARSSPAMTELVMALRALFFDVFGTLVDWRSGVAREAERILKPLGFAFDWLVFADAWRGEYQGAMEEVRAGRIAFCKLDVLHRRNLDRILPRFGVGALPEETARDLNL